MVLELVAPNEDAAQRLAKALAAGRAVVEVVAAQPAAQGDVRAFLRLLSATQSKRPGSRSVR